MKDLIKAVVVDDELPSRETLVHFLGKYFPEIKVLGTADGVRSGLELIKKQQPDVVFLDIQMMDGTGFDLVDQLGDSDARIIFVTAYSEFALKAFNYFAIDYLLKPIDPEELKGAVDKLSLSLKPSRRQISEAIQSIRDTKLEKIALPDAEGITFVRINEIVRCHSYKNYTEFFTVNGEKITVSKTLKYYEDLLPSDRFFRIHQSHLINLSFIKRYQRIDGGRVIMEDGSSLEISRRKKEQFLKQLPGT